MVGYPVRIQHVRFVRTLAIAGSVIGILYLIATILQSYRVNGAYEAGRDLILRHQPLQAITHLDWAVQRSPTDLRIRRELYEAYRQLGDYTKALALAKDTLRLAKTKEEHREWTGALGLAYLRTGALMDAEEIAQQLISDLNDPGGYVILLEIRQQQDRHKEAIQYGQHALKLIDPKLGLKSRLSIHTRLAYSFILLKERDEAIKTIRDATTKIDAQEHQLAKMSHQPSPERPFKALLAYLEALNGDKTISQKMWGEVVELSGDRKDGLRAFAKDRMASATATAPPSIQVLIDQFER